MRPKPYFIFFFPAKHHSHPNLRPWPSAATRPTTASAAIAPPPTATTTTAHLQNPRLFQLWLTSPLPWPPYQQRWDHCELPLIKDSNTNHGCPTISRIAMLTTKPLFVWSKSNPFYFPYILDYLNSILFYFQFPVLIHWLTILGSIKWRDSQFKPLSHNNK